MNSLGIPRKEVIQPHLTVRLPCYDFTPLTLHTFDASPPCGLGRIFNVLGETVDKVDEKVEADDYWPIHRPTPKFPLSETGRQISG